MGQNGYNYWAATMKAKDLEKQNIDPIKGHKIVCPDCGHFIGYSNDFTYMVIQYPGVVCPICNEIIIHATSIVG